MNKCSSVHKFACNPEILEQASELFKAMGDPTRLQILCSLMAGECLAGELAEVCGHTQSAISHQLRLLRTLRLVRARRMGRNIFYSLDDAHVADIIRMALTHTDEKNEPRASSRTRKPRA